MVGITWGVTFGDNMALVQKSTKISFLVLEYIKKEVKMGLYPNENMAINEILKKHYGIPSEFQQLKKLQQTKK